jgi:hypothetical protein
MRKSKPLGISTDVKKLWKGGPLAFSFWLRGLRPRRNVLLCPCRSARGPFGFVCPRTAATRQRGIVADWRGWGKRKMHEGLCWLSHTMHNFSTSTILVQFRAKPREIPPNFPKLGGMRTTDLRLLEILPEEKSGYSPIFTFG